MDRVAESSSGSIRLDHHPVGKDPGQTNSGAALANAQADGCHSPGAGRRLRSGKQRDPEIGAFRMVDDPEKPGRWRRRRDAFERIAELRRGQEWIPPAIVLVAKPFALVAQSARVRLRRLVIGRGRLPVEGEGSGQRRKESAEGGERQAARALARSDCGSEWLGRRRQRDEADALRTLCPAAASALPGLVRVVGGSSSHRDPSGPLGCANGGRGKWGTSCHGGFGLTWVRMMNSARTASAGTGSSPGDGWMWRSPGTRMRSSEAIAVMKAAISW